MKTNNFSTYFSALVLLFSFFISQTLLAQDEWVEDPLKKTEVWKQLKANPIDTKLWSDYFGKSLSELSPKEKQQFSEWKQELMLRHLADNEAVVGFVVDIENSDDVFIDEDAYSEIEKRIQEALKNGEMSVSLADFTGLEAMIMLESNSVKELKRNILQNFVILEDLYNDRFEEYSAKYTYYNEEHPDGKYDFIKWIDEQDAKLHDLKMVEVNQLKAKYKVGQY
jgi:hypothetical protein